MQRTPTKRQKTVKALSDPQPQFVSLVMGGANQVPFRAIKSEVQPVAKGTEDMTTDNAADQYNIVKLVFHPAQFATKAAVKTWLEAGGYGDCAIVEDGDSFVATSATQKDDAELETRIVRDPSGVDVYVAVMPESDVVEAAEMPVLAEVTEKSDNESLTIKFDTWVAGMDGGVSLADGLNDGFDGIPPGLSEVMAVFYSVIGNAIKANVVERVESVCSELAQIIVKLAGMFPAPPHELPDNYEEATKMFKARGQMAEIVEQAMKAGGKTIPAPLAGTPEGEIDETRTIDVTDQPVAETQMNGTVPGGSVSVPEGQTNNVPEHGTVPGAVAGTPSGQQINSPEHGTVGGAGPEVPQGQAIDEQSDGTTKGKTPKLPEGDAQTVQSHGTPTGGTLPAGQTQDTQARAVMGKKNDETGSTEAPPAWFLAAFSGVTDALKAMTETVTSVKSDNALLIERVSAVETGGRQSRKGADVEYTTSATQAPTDAKAVESRKTADFMTELHLHGSMGLRRSS